MKLQEAAALVDAEIICGDSHMDRTVSLGFASDLMSDVLTLLDDNILLVTGLCNIQSVRTAEMSDIKQILFVRNKRPTKDMVALAREQGITLMATPYSMFKTSGILFQAGLNPVY